jgi:plasmid replication initiation protein
MKKENLAIPKKNKLAVTQSNKLVEARYSLTLNEQRIVLFMISLIQPEDVDFNDYDVKLSDIVKLAGLKNKNIQAELKDLLVDLRRKELVIPEQDGFLVTGWVSSAKYKEDEGIVQLSFDPKLKPYLLKLKEQFTKYHLFHVTHFQSSYTIRIYMLLKQYEKLGFREFELSELREILGIEEHQYQRFSDFKKRVINVAQSEFLKKDASGQYLSDITFQLETIRAGRKISRLRFVIEHQDISSAQLELPIIDDDKAIPAIILEYEEYGIDRTLTLTELEKQGEKALYDCLELFKAKLESTNLKNPSGYLLGMLNKGAGKKTKAQQLEAERQQKKQAEERQQYLEKQRKKLEEEFTKKAKQDYLDSLTEPQKEELLEEVRQLYADNPAILNLIDDIGSPIAEGYVIKKIPHFEERKNTHILECLKSASSVSFSSESGSCTV